MAHPTINDVARLAGVSKSLVSLVMRGAPNVSDGRRAAVLEAAEELGYRPNAAARSLVQRRTQIIGVMVSDLHNPFFVESLDGMEAAAENAGYRILMSNGLRVTRREEASLEALLEMRTDALILTAPQLGGEAISRAATAVPVVLVAKPSRDPNVDTVSSDDKRGARLAVDHLVSLGHQRIAHIDGHRGPSGSSRRSGYMAAMKANGLEGHIQVAAGGHAEQDGYRAALELLARSPRPTAIFAFNDLAAIGAMNAIEESGLGVPGDISLVGYDNTRLSGMRHIGLSTVDQPRFEMGKRALEVAVDRIEHGRGEPARIVLEPTLVPRATTVPPPR